MGKLIDLTNKKFGRLLVIQRAYPKNKKGVFWYCDCDCGNKNIVVIGNSLKTGNTKSCGCLLREWLDNNHRKHNKYNLSGNFGIGYTQKGYEFYFDLEDYDKIKNHCWSKTSKGYLGTKYTCENGKRTCLLLHKLIMNIDIGKNIQIDHINHSCNDNRKINLRKVTPSQNSFNRSYMSNNTSGILGVCFLKNRKKWLAYITINKKTITLGEYKELNDAVLVRKRAEEEYFGKYSYENSKDIK